MNFHAAKLVWPLKTRCSNESSENESSRVFLGKSVLNRYSACRFLAIRSGLAHFPNALSKSSTGVVVPLYIYPGSSWQVVIQAKRSHPSVPIVTIVNPDSGPGTLSDANYATEIKNLQTAGVTDLLCF